MAAVPGKNKLSRAVTVSIDNSAAAAQVMSGDLIADSINGLGFTAGEIDMTGASNTVGNYLADRKENTLTMKFHANDTATTGATTVLNGIVGLVGTVLIEIGDAGAAPTTADLTFSGEFVCLGAPLSVEGGKLVHTVTFRPGTSTAPAWGTKA